MRSARALCVALLLSLAGPAGAAPLSIGRLAEASRMQIGIGDRLEVRTGGRWRSPVEVARERGLEVDLFQIWLPRGWKEDWVPVERLRALAERGVTPVVVHYFFGDEISKERVESESDAWYASMWRMAQLLRIGAPVLVVLEPEFNNAPPPGETAITEWPWFADELRSAARMIRKEAPNARIGTCPGDFAGRPNLEPVLGPAVDDLDFLAFQEMRASTESRAGEDGYLEVGRSAVDFARYLKRAFQKPLLLAYVAVSSFGGWEDEQAAALRDLHAHRAALREAGVFGVIYFQLLDDPEHEGYFGPAERHFGLLHSDGRPKPALEAFRAWTARETSHDHPPDQKQRKDRKERGREERGR